MCDEVVTRGPWLTSDLSRHINQLELLAAFHALRSFAAGAVNISIHFFLDNSTAVSYINKCGGTRSRRLCVLAQQFCSFCESRNIYVTASHLPGAFIQQFIRNCRYSVPHSSRQQRLASRQRSFSSSVARLAGRHRSLRIRLERSTESIRGMVSPARGLGSKRLFTELGRAGRLRVPILCTNRPLFVEGNQRSSDNYVSLPTMAGSTLLPLVLEMVCDEVIILPQSSRLLTSARGEIHPMQESGLTLTAWRLSGVDWRCRVFRERKHSLVWVSCCCFRWFCFEVFGCPCFNYVVRLEVAPPFIRFFLVCFHYISFKGLKLCRLPCQRSHWLTLGFVIFLVYFEELIIIWMRRLLRPDRSHGVSSPSEALGLLVHVHGHSSRALGSGI